MGGTRGSMDLASALYFCCACAENVPKPSSARKMPARTKNRPIKTRRLKKADSEADFFFIGNLFACFSDELRCYRSGQALVTPFFRQGSRSRRFGRATSLGSAFANGSCFLK